jgi:hypothetical protein
VLTGQDVVEEENVVFTVELYEEDCNVKWLKDGVEICPDGKRVQVRSSGFQNPWFYICVPNNRRLNIYVLRKQMFFALKRNVAL